VKGPKGSSNTGTKPMKFLTDPQYTALLANGLAARAARDAGLDFDPMPVIKLIAPGECKRWLLTEIDPINNDYAYGLVDEGDGRPSLSFVRWRELESPLGQRKYTVVADPRFVADAPLSVYANLAYTRGLIIT
jgi:hypothetical protein